MDLETLEIFVEAMRLRNFSGVARQRKVDPSRVSREMARLEKTLGVKLFEREVHELVPTQAAEGYLERIKQPLRQLKRAREQAREQSGELQGDLTLAAPQTLWTDYLMTHLATWRQEHPLVSVQLLVRESSPMDFSREAIDLGFQTGPGGGLGCHQLLRIDYKLCASPQWGAHIKLDEPRQLEELDCLAARDCWRFINRFGDSSEITVRGTFQCEQEKILQQAAVAGLGPAILPSWLAEGSLRRGELVELLPDWRAERVGFDLGIWAVWPGPNLTPKGRAFLRHLQRGEGLSGPKTKGRVCNRS